MTQISEKQILNFLGLLYETANETAPEKWASLYRHLIAIFSAGPGSLSLLLGNKKKFSMFAPTIDPEFYRQYEEYYQKVNPFHKVITEMAPGERFSRQKFISDPEFLKTEIYQDYYKKNDMFHLEYLTLFKCSDITGGVWLSRPKSKTNFTRKELETMHLLLPHLQNAFKIYINVAEARGQDKLMLEILGRIPHLVIVLDKSGRAVFINEPARRIINAKDGLEFDRSGMLKASLASDTKRLRVILQNVFTPDLNKQISFGKVLHFARPSGLRPLSAIISPFSRQNLFNSGTEDYALLFVDDPEQVVEINEQVLCDLFGLTAAESRLAAIISKGHSLSEACDLLKVKQNTARTHLKRIFSKTDTKRQSELVRLVLNSIANLNF